jgi:hypothetical protein
MVRVGYLVIVSLTPYPADIRVVLFITYTNPFKNISLSFTKVSYVDELRFHQFTAIANRGFINDFDLISHQSTSVANTAGAIEYVPSG